MEVVAKNTLLPKNMSFCQPSRLPWIPHQQRVLALENISNFRHLALYSKQFQTFNFAPKFQKF